MTQADWEAEAAIVEQDQYQRFLDQKTQYKGQDAIPCKFVPEMMFPFQVALLEWACQIGRGAIFADCGLGKTIVELAWAQNVVEHTNRPVVILAPLAVSRQIVEEGAKFGIECDLAENRTSRSKIVVTNYERIHHLDSADFVGGVCDESSCLKNFSGRRRKDITEFLRNMRYRHMSTATAAPNDYTELGTSSEALGRLGYVDMLGRFFKNDQNTNAQGGGGADWKKLSAPKWRFKGHSEEPFWRWVCSWARACRKPSDIGFDDAGFDLPPLQEVEHMVHTKKLRPGMLFPLPARDLREEREERRLTIEERCETVAGLVDHDRPAVVWCHLNDEGKLLKKLIPDAEEIAGSTPDEKKMEIFERFRTGETRVLVTKPKIGAWGLNWQHCNHVVTFVSHSYEQYYQSVRRCWRFGQQRPVTVDIVATEGEVGIKANMQRKAVQASRMFDRLVANMQSSEQIERSTYEQQKVETPKWL